MLKMHKKRFDIINIYIPPQLELRSLFITEKRATYTGFWYVHSISYTNIYIYIYNIIFYYRNKETNKREGLGFTDRKGELCVEGFFKDDKLEGKGELNIFSHL